MLRTSNIVPLLLAAIYCIPASGQAPAATLYIELQNVVEYQVDTPDLSKYGTDPNVTPGKIAKGLGVGCAGVQLIGYGDIVSVNGQPARGTYANRGVAVCVTPTPVPGVNGSNAISDTTWPSMRDETYEILQSDGITPVGTIMTIGLHSGSPTPPGPPAGSKNSAITGGTGAFFGVRGQRGQTMLSGNVPERTASITEDPAKRRQNGGGHLLTILYVIPMSWPTVVTTAGGTSHRPFQRLLAGQRVQAGRCGRDSVSVRYRARADPHQPNPGPAVSIESSGGGQLAH